MSMLESKLLTALSELGNAQGTGLKSDSPTAPSSDLIKAFEDAMQNNSQGNEQSAQYAMNENEQNTFSKVEFDQRADYAKDLKSQGIDSESGRVYDVDQSSESQSLDGRASFRQDVERAQENFQANKPESREELLKELITLAESFTAEGGQITAVDLFRTQYILGMLGTQSKTGMKVSQTISTGLETLLKQKD